MPLFATIKREPVAAFVTVVIVVWLFSSSIGVANELLEISALTGFSTRISKQLRLAKAACESRKKGDEVCVIAYVPASRPKQLELVK